MKNSLITILLFLLAFGSQAQTWDAKLENAQFQMRVNHHAAYTSQVKKAQGLFTKEEYNRIVDRCLTKEGVFKLDLSSDKSTVTVYFLDWIDHLTIDWLFTEADRTLDNVLRIHPQEEFNF